LTPNCEDFVIATGASRSDHVFLLIAFAAAVVDGDPMRSVRKGDWLLRANEIMKSKSNPTKAHVTLGWKPQVTFKNSSYNVEKSK
jgi:GDP-D-mannose dehydratase